MDYLSMRRQMKKINKIMEEIPDFKQMGLTAEEVEQMSLNYKPTKHAFFTEGESLTEQEHAPSCDINLIYKNLKRGIPVRGGGSNLYGEDDTTLDPVTYRITKAQIESELSALAQEPFEEEHFEKIPKKIREKFGFKKRSRRIPASKNDELNDEKKNAGLAPDSQSSPNPSNDEG